MSSNSTYSKLLLKYKKLITFESFNQKLNTGQPCLGFCRSGVTLTKLRFPVELQSSYKSVRNFSCRNTLFAHAESVTKRNISNNMHKSSLKRNSTHLKWLLSGCCFSKKSKNDKNVDDSCVASDAILERTEDALDTEPLISEVACGEEAGCSAQIQIDFLSEEKLNSDGVTLEVHPTIDFKDTPRKDKDEHLGAEKKSITVSTKGGGGKLRPNYFVAVQVDNPEIHNLLQSVQDAIMEKKPTMKSALISLPSLHITFVVMHISDEDDLKRASEALVDSYRSVKEDLEENPLYLTFEGLSHFRKKVLYADIKTDEGHRRIYNLYETIASCFESHGFDVREKGGFTAHLTVAKLSQDPKLYKKGVKVISPAWYEDFVDTTFGLQLVKGLQLLRMGGPKDDKGYYHCHKECLFNLTPKVPEDQLQKMSEISLEEKKKIRQKICDLTAKQILESQK